MLCPVLRLASSFQLREHAMPAPSHDPRERLPAQLEDAPRVDASLDDMRQTDFLPFRRVLGKAFSEGVWGMVSHVIYAAVDARAPASCSRRVIWDAIRRDIGFRGLLLSDDICMGALAQLGDSGARTDRALRAGCDVVLHCSGDMSDMEKAAKRARPLTAEAVARYNRSISIIKQH